VSDLEDYEAQKSGCSAAGGAAGAGLLSTLVAFGLAPRRRRQQR
jgi:MYXO-CTERM domain-containing protein